MKKLSFLLMLALLCCLLLAPLAGTADGYFTLNVDALDMTRLNQDDYVAQYLSAQTQGISVRKFLSNSSELAAPVRLSLMQMDTQTLVFDKNYGYQSGTFDSGVIYLPFMGNHTVPYLVTLYVGDTVYAIPFMLLQARLTNNGACTYGPHLYDLDPALGQDWLMGTMIDLNALRTQGYMAVDLCASNTYLIGQANLYLQGDQVCVQLATDPNANVEIHSLSIYLVTDCSCLYSTHSGSIPSPAYHPGDWIDIGSADSALLYIPMQVSYDPSGLPTFGYDLSYGFIQNQLSLWNQNRFAQPIPTPDAPAPDPNAGWFGDIYGTEFPPLAQENFEPAFEDDFPQE
ncbi:MAG: hypothetical protein E7319_08245 [Clostridiales bacterium]|nr:hypothetical protein [Clostridiales bacterium]